MPPTRCHNQFLCLGSGTSHGVPMIGCTCKVCRSTNPKNKRTRSSGIYYHGHTAILIDTSTDLRQQALRHRLNHIDAVLYTHAHADHLHGIDDLRSFTLLQRNVIPCYGDAETLALIRERYPYLFKDPDFSLGWSIPRLDMRPAAAPFDLDGATITPIPIFHGKALILGYRIDRFAYLTDCSAIPDASMTLLRNLHTLILDGLRPRPHATHFCIAQALEIIEELRPEQAFLTHLTHDVDHDVVEAELPESVHLAYDGLTVPIPESPLSER